MTTTLFTWGYFGWGNATAQLVEAVDAVERSRGFNPPLFVDVRIRRAVRAKGFQGNAFGELLGPERHRWMKSLGNRCILTGRPGIEIAEPTAAATLLDLALAEAERRRRILFFCSCQWPREKGKTTCHRDTVADLVLAAAQERGKAVTLIEWPGGEPASLDLPVSPEVFTAVRRGRKTVPLDRPASLATFAGLPWGSVVTVTAGEQAMRVLSGPAAYQQDQWVLPVFEPFSDPDTPRRDIDSAASNLRRSQGLTARSA